MNLEQMKKWQILQCCFFLILHLIWNVSPVANCNFICLLVCQVAVFYLDGWALDQRFKPTLFLHTKIPFFATKHEKFIKVKDDASRQSWLKCVQEKWGWNIKKQLSKSTVQIVYKLLLNLEQRKKWQILQRSFFLILH